MEFYDVLDQVLELLRSRGRMSYRALKRQFHLDDSYIADLKEELLYSHPVVEEHGRGLAWTGAAAASEIRSRHGSGTAMRFHALLPVLMALLQGEGRMTYRTLKQALAITQPLLDDLRDELLFRRFAVDEDGKGLVWTGRPYLPGQVAAARSDAYVPPDATAITSPAARTRPPSATPIHTPHDTPATAAVHSVPEAERRQLTVMFCDLAASTQLSQQLDAEDLREVIRAYQETAAEVIDRFGGYIAQYLGDGLLVYFGWPRAHEDDAQRAVHTGLGIVEAITTTLNPHLEQEKSVQLAVRIGLHTGPVVVGEMGSGGRQEHLATGDTVNIAARLEGLAALNTVVLSPTTAQLVRDASVLDDLGLRTLKGVAEPMQVFRVVALREADQDVEDTVTGSFAALVGRDEEIGLLRRRWEQSKEGFGQVVLISGEAGIGKSSLVEDLRVHIRQEGALRMAFRCSQYTQHSALYPVIAHLQRVLGWRRDDPAETRLAALEQVLEQTNLPLEETVPLLAGLLSLPLPAGRYAPLALTSQQQRQQTQDALVAWMLEDAERQPVLAVWEDLHWADPSTLELLGLFIDQVPTVPMLHVLAFRPTFVPPWPAQSHMTPLTLNRLERPQVETMIRRLAGGKPLPAEVVQHIVAKTDGVPLYVEELTKMLLESDLLHEDADQYILTGSLATAAIPATLHDSLMARLDRLPTVREVAQLGAVLGREFAYEMLQALAVVEEPALQEGLSQLVNTELLYQRGRPPRATYTFRHALIRDTAYQSLLRRTRQQMHQQVAQLLEARFPDIVEAQPELVAHHYTEAGLATPAIAYWQQAGQRATQRSANHEALAHLTQGLDVVAQLPETSERLQQELALQLPLGAALLMTKGHGAPEVEATYTRAYAICRQLGDTPELFPALFGLWRFYIVVPAFKTTREIGAELLRLAQSAHDPALLVVAHYALGFPSLCLGDVAAARTHFKEGAALYAPEQRRLAVFRAGQDPGAACRCYGAWALWLLGYPEQARTCANEALVLARELEHPFTLGYALSFSTMVLQFCGELQGAHEQTEQAIALSSEHGFTLWREMGVLLQGWALAAQGQSEAGLASLRQGLASFRAMGVNLLMPYFHALLAEVYGLTGQIEEGLRVLAEALALTEKAGERWWEAEVHRQQGELLLAQEGPGQKAGVAEACFQRALAVARRQQAKSLELRAAMSLSRLWQQQGNTDAARALLAPVYGWFSEGFDTSDLREARTLLHDLA